MNAGSYVAPARRTSESSTSDVNEEQVEFDFSSRPSKSLNRNAVSSTTVTTTSTTSAPLVSRGPITRHPQGGGLASLLWRKKDKRPHFRLIKRSNPYSFNIRNIHLPIERIYGDLYHTLLDQSWWKIGILVTLLWIMIHLFFGSLYYIDLSGIDNERAEPIGFADCVFFSVQTMETIGYGRLNPLSYYVNIVACIEAYVGVVMWACFSGLIFAKVARPSRQKRYIVFSQVAVINSQERWWEGSVDAVDQGRYRFGGLPCLVFRFANIRRSQVCDGGFHLLLVRKEPERTSDLESDISYTNSDWSDDSIENINAEEMKTDAGEKMERVKKRQGSSSNKRYVYRIHELNFEINNQEGRTRGNDLPVPLLPLPWTVVHPIDEKSPLRGATPSSLKASGAEIIAVLDGLYEGSATSVQARFSYTFEDIIWNAKFAPMVREDPRRGCLESDYAKLSEVIYLEEELTEEVPPSIHDPSIN